MAQPRFPSRGRVSGPPVEFVSYREEKGPLGKLGPILSSLKKEGINPGRISVLLAKTPTDEEQATLDSLGVVPITSRTIGELGSYSKVTYAIVSGFKGLENDVIILIGIENIDGDWWRGVSYVGMSRACTRLFVVLTDKCENIRRSRWEEYLESRFEEVED
jgi:hypothetical protein